MGSSAMGGAVVAAAIAGGRLRQKKYSFSYKTKLNKKEKRTLLWLGKDVLKTAHNKTYREGEKTFLTRKVRDKNALKFNKKKYELELFRYG